ncbi:hypothetical protein QQF64_006195 [Cirrhinus molitorella]|uniref:Retrotransposon gag domain-containing protein n=1 Tax=Cirrhinus molitorella TaxID=172907 RepID=A0ABR3MGL7_9TELE
MAPKRARGEKPAQMDPGDDVEDLQGAGGSAVELMPSESSSQDIADLKDMFQKFLMDQKVRQVRQEQENAWQETRWRSLQHQFRLLQGEVSQHTSRGNLPAAGSEDQGTSSRMSDGGQHPFAGGLLKEPKMQQLSEMDDIEHYLTTFERIATVCKWPSEDWAIRLVPLLTGKARAAYVAMDVEEMTDYGQVKEAILKKYSINSETYRQRFCTMEVLMEETPKECMFG